MKNNLFFFAVLSSMLFSLENVYAGPSHSDLEDLYRANPGLVTQANPEILRAQALKFLKDQNRADEIYELATGDLDQFIEAQKSALENLRANPPAKKLGRVVVSGQSVTGMIAAAIAAQSGHQVSVYDLRMAYTRDIQWSVRQPLIDVVASIDAELGEKFVKNVGRDLKQVFMITPKEVESAQRTGMLRPDPRRIPSLSQALDGNGVATVQAKDFEKLLYAFLSKHPNVTQKKGKIEIGPLDPVTKVHTIIEYEDVTPAGEKTKVYKKVAEGTPITVIAEGAGSASRKSLGIESAPISPARYQVAGVVHIEKGGEIITEFREEDSCRWVTGSIATSDCGKRWVVADINKSKVTPDAAKFGVDEKAPEYAKERTSLLEKEFRRVAASSMQRSVESIDGINVSGAIENNPLQTFELQQHISNKGASGANVLLLGDAVGNGHWSVGGGVPTGTIGHGEKFKLFLAKVDGGGSQLEAAKSYSDAVIKDSQVWGERGLRYFYDFITKEESIAAYQTAADLYLKGKVKTPEKALNLMLPEGRLSKKMQNIRLKCDEIALRILGDL